MKKIVAILMALTLALSAVACAAPAPAAEAAPAAAAGEASNKLSVWCWDPAFNLYAMEEAAKVYQKDHPDFELEIVETPWDDLQPKLITAATSGSYDSLPDMFLMQDNAFQKNVINYPDMFTDLTSTGIDFSQFGAAKTAYSVVDGKNYGVPFDNGACIAALRTDILEQAGYTVEDFTDTTWVKFIEMGEDILAKTGKPLLSGQAGSVDMLMIMLQSCGSSMFNADGTPNIVNNAELAECIGLYTDMVKKGVFLEVNNWDEYIATLVNGTVAGTINGCWILASIQTAADQAGNWRITNLPKLSFANATNYSNNGGSSWAVSSNCKNVDLAVDFFKSTFAGSVELYETILPSSGALATYLPAGESDVYGQPQAFFGDQPIYALITEYAGKIPSNITGAYYYEARDAVGAAMTKVVAGDDAAACLKEAEETLKFQMGA